MHHSGSPAGDPALPGRGSRKAGAGPAACRNPDHVSVTALVAAPAGV